MIAFSLRREGGNWQSYFSDKDNRIEMIIPSGGYYLKVNDVIRKTFFIDMEKTSELFIE